MLSLTLRTESTLPVELPGLTPEAVRGKSLGEVERLSILHGREQLPLGELFAVRGETSDSLIELTGDLTHVHCLASGMTEGEFHIQGDVGDSLGAEMRGGLIRVEGNAGNGVGAARPGTTRGMRGGTIVVTGDAGDGVGTKMRRGLIVIGGNAGNLLGHDMLAGTIVVMGGCGAGPGAGMKRGTLCLLGPTTPQLLPSFRYACTSQFAVLELLWRQLESLGLEATERLVSEELDLVSGDLLSLGRGEIFTPASGL